jgi:hypothetical protein
MSLMGTPYLTPPIVMKIFPVMGYEVEQGIYQIPDDWDWNEPGMSAWMEEAAWFEVIIRVVWDDQQPP